MKIDDYQNRYNWEMWTGDLYPIYTTHYVRKLLKQPCDTMQCPGCDYDNKLKIKKLSK